ncbi:Clp protease ATP-binding protein [Clostridium carboxidivorans P7]|uniref:ATP-dependent Clp protease, ATP-binding subunit clpA n=1 Tax=Clostridium carboxidivorans P7 TaxID=536227 RepID=C6Q0C6_9CLOT|nr:ATP-dependent Clp protease ATP-binding subunit ClpA [Clostridium carboxidivorans]AKN29509.1 Clp protease ATP-binding protein [Clostridium carboxidivorans P7]EET85053.1 ATP-dependent Clp protease, ATP-binding subunit clpA [Clostridium carboxidivorans P7]EFG89568.1 ATP-dependent Clp protease ATP-binding subunit ClpA [Clostridium carboxidivorans P7]
MKLDTIVNEIITAAYNEAKYSKHEYFTPEHILYASLFFEEGKKIIENCGGNVEYIKEDLIKYFKDNMDLIEKGEPTETVGIGNIVASAGQHVLSAEKEIIGLGDIFVAMYDEEESYASYFLKKQGIQRLDMLEYITHGASEFDLEEIEEDVYEENHERQEEGSLSQYTMELTERARNGQIDPLIGREDVLDRTIQVLSRRLKNNPIHVGEPGVGKTAITEGLAKMIVENKVPKLLQGSKIYSLDMGTLLAGTKYRGDFENRIKNVLKNLEKQEKAIVYIDEIHTIIGAGAVSGGSVDASNILKPFLAKGNIKFIGSTTYDEYKKVFEKDKALARRFQKIEVREPSIEDTFNILDGLKESYEQFHNVKYTEEALRAAVELSAKYITDRYLPDKAIDVMDEVGAYVKLHSEKEGTVEIHAKDVEKIVASIAKIPEKTVSVDEADILKNLDETIKKEIFGQEKAIESIVTAIKKSRAGFNDENKTVANLLFVGPTGVGKTEICKQVSKALNIPLIRFDMSEYQEKHTVARLIGAPPGYVGYEEGGLLTDAVRKNPYCVLLLDEIEKVHPDVLNVLLQLMDYATLTDSTGKKVDFRNVILIMTSNAGARSIGKPLMGFGGRTVENENIDKEIERFFSPEFRNRLDNIIVFNKMNEDMALLVAKKTIREFEEKLKTKNIKIQVTEKCYKWLASKGLSLEYGAREIIRIISQQIKPYFVDKVLFGDVDNKKVIVIDTKEDKVFIS